MITHRNAIAMLSGLVYLVQKVFVIIFSMYLCYHLAGSRDGAVVRALASHQCGLGSIPGLDVICGLSLLLVLILAPRGFSPGTPVFPSPQKTTFLNSNSICQYVDT